MSKKAEKTKNKREHYDWAVSIAEILLFIPRQIV